MLAGLSLLLGCLVAVGSAEDPPAEGQAASATDAAATVPVAVIPSQGTDARQGAEDAADEAAPPAVRELLSRLESGNAFLRGTERYAATFTQQVLKDGELLDPEQIEIKVQHEPFGVFLRWKKDDQHALYVEGAHDNKLLVHPTRGFGRLRKVWQLDPASGLAMRGARRPVTELGMLNMVKLLLGFHREHLLISRCAVQKDDLDEAEATRYTLTFDGPHQNPYFAKTILWLCDQRHIPLRIENYAWSDDRQVGTLLESYHYTEICVEDCVTEADFDRNNGSYKF